MKRPILKSSEDARKFVLAVDIPAAELAVRIIEAETGLLRPAGRTAEEALAALDRNIANQALRAGAAAMRYFQECVSRSAGLQ